VLLHDHQVSIVSSEFVTKAIQECDLDTCGSKLVILIGHYLGFLANLVTQPPVDSKMPYSIVLMVLNQDELI
jgi:hypothetical protein